MALLGIAAEDDPYPAQAQRTDSSPAGAPLTLASASADLEKVTTAKACVEWRNKYRRVIQASSERDKIQEEFTRRLNELKQMERPK